MTMTFCKLGLHVLRHSGVLANFVAITIILVGTSSGCRKNEAAARDANPPGPEAVSAGASGSAPMGIARGLPFSPEKVASVVNPGGLPIYRGPVGSVVGKVTVKGDPPPRRAGQRPPEAKCGKEAVEAHEYLFRVGPDGGLADAIVGVTGYDGFLPARGDAVEVKIRGCSFDQRTIVMTYGQRLDVHNLDPKETYLPHLEGARAPALMVAMPGGDPIRLYPPRPGSYMLLDDLKHPWMVAEVFVFKFPTATVTDATGAFKVEGVPVGEVQVGVRHPDIGQTLEKTVK
ncbi:MAG: hypothetical protein RMJ98_17115, partial [Myxococcales bacterium]|nr:hypothetical protein [Polyangiaceae bacterium]MDW8251017.1 hypothetical protein [Myxococcales bacterium]